MSLKAAKVVEEPFCRRQWQIITEENGKKPSETRT
jgi:hypothetical protein